MEPKRSLTQNPDFLSAAETRFFRRLNRAAGLLLLMLRLCRPLSTRQAAYLLGLNYKTTARYFLTLQEMGLVRRERTSQEFWLVDALLDAIPLLEDVRAPAVQNLPGITVEPGNFYHAPPVVNTKDIKLNEECA
jgi:hypothetical protein